MISLPLCLLFSFRFPVVSSSLFSFHPFCLLLLLLLSLLTPRDSLSFFLFLFLFLHFLRSSRFPLAFTLAHSFIYFILLLATLITTVLKHLYLNCTFPPLSLQILKRLSTIRLLD